VEVETTGHQDSFSSHDPPSDMQNTSQLDPARTQLVAVTGILNIH